MMMRFIPARRVHW